MVKKLLKPLSMYLFAMCFAFVSVLALFNFFLVKEFFSQSWWMPPIQILSLFFAVVPAAVAIVVTIAASFDLYEQIFTEHRP